MLFRIPLNIYVNIGNCSPPKEKIARRQEKGVRSSYLISVYANFGIGVALGIGNAQCIVMHIKGAPGGTWGHLGAPDGSHGFMSFLGDAQYIN